VNWTDDKGTGGDEEENGKEYELTVESSLDKSVPFCLE
jgi:hypothetical protein